MINVNVVDGKIVGFAESNAPIPNRVTRTITKSGNYGLADNARKMFKSLCVVPKEEKPDETDELVSFMAAGRGRGRGRPLRPFDPLPKPAPPSFPGSEQTVGLNSHGVEKIQSPIKETPSDSFCGDDTSGAPSNKPPIKYVTECFFNRGEEVRACGLVNAHSKRATATVSAKPSKANGYVMYLHYMKKVNGVTESKTTDQLIKMYDKDWKALTEDERKVWKEKAKATRPARPPPDNAPGRFQPGPPKAKNATRANAIAHGLTAAGLVDDGEDDGWPDSADDYY